MIDSVNMRVMSRLARYKSSGQIVGPDVIARFAAWLLLDVLTRRFTETDWDIRDEEHHIEWCDGPLYSEPE